MDEAELGIVQLSVSDHSQIGSLQRYQELTAPETRISRVAGQPQPGEQGALDILAVLASSGGLVAAIKTLPEFLRSRRSKFSVSVKVNDEEFKLTAENVNDVLPILERILDR